MNFLASLIINTLNHFFIRVRCTYNGHYWVTGSIEVDDQRVTRIIQYCARDCGAAKYRSYSAPRPPTP